EAAAVVQPGAGDRADRRGRAGCVLEGGARLLDRLAELGLAHLAHVGEARLGRRVAQLAELALELLAVLLGHEADVEEAHDLPELHRRALHRPQRRHDLLGRLQVTALERLVAPLLVTREVRRARAEMAGGLAGRQARYARRAREPGRRDPVLRHPA